MSDRPVQPSDLLTLLEDAVVGVFRSTPEGAFLWLNAALARLFGFEQRPLLEFSSAEKADVDVRQLFS